MQTNHAATGGYQIQSLEKRVSELSNYTQKLQSELATYQSMANIQERLKAMPMVEAGAIKYLKPLSGAVAQR